MGTLIATRHTPCVTRGPEWDYTRDGNARGYIQPHRLDELWFHTGTACNLSCPFCLEGSGPGDRRLGQPTFEEVRRYIDEAIELGVRQFSFTGGEPFVNRDLIEILGYALDRRPCLVLTNGTRPLRSRLGAVHTLRSRANSLAFRVSLDSPAPRVHDAGRGQGSFDYSLATMQLLHEAGFGVSVARLIDPQEDTERVESDYRAVFTMHGLPESLRIVGFPDFGKPNSVSSSHPEITTQCMTRYHSAESRARFMCSFSKMVIKHEGRMRVYACTLVDDNPDYDLGESLRESLQERVMMKHSRCFACFSRGASCSET